MKRIELRIRDESGQLVSEQSYELEIGGGSFAEIEQAVEAFKARALGRVEGELLKQEQKRFTETVKKKGSID